jgi:hypothetical protein
MTLDVKKSNSSNETPNVMTVGVEKYGLKWNAREKTLLFKFYEAPHIVGQLYGVPHGLLRVFNTILYKNEFQKSSNFSPSSKVFFRAFNFSAVAVLWLSRENA